ncbi:hypothetical protein PEX1_045270 [Penicillium expansum]|uniref:DUF7703 domain-containing protein n=1 Tax=Penicillium expansum TaxID=27334 RepID=A0A0A2I7N7_PENEN|nr:hypothetical protein PEX2_082260 [Penicillium expansum]KGO36370.1 hypothetical protein PEXP_103300 [Penicillium expansum]KGO41180.1 hypothetical protein PEX1_045270 [Penicillium expansum]KGO52579.1 hypothetical protein PEX2_082260 [Penicillium expansum]
MLQSLMAHDDAAGIATHKCGTSSALRTGIFAAFLAIAWYNALELIIICFVSFKRWNGTYFWSLLIASACIILNCLGFMLLFFPTGVTPWLCVTLVLLGWFGMVTGQSVVLWSRLHLVLYNTKLLRGLLLVICIDAVLLHIPASVLLYGTVAYPTSVWAHGYNVMERIELVCFCLQELIISSIYAWETVKLLRLRPEGRPKGILNQLLFINIIIVLLDITVIFTQFVGYYTVQVMFKSLTYSIKLKLEYVILGKLVTVSRGCDSHELPLNAREINVSSFPSDRDSLWNLESW